VNTEEALQVADKAADRNTPAADHPSIVNMVYALEILANGLRHWQEKAKAWETSSGRMARRAMDATAARDRAVREGRELNAELDRTQGEWSGLMEFIRTALGLSPQSLGVDERALCDKTDPRSILGQVFADARLLRRIRDEVNGRVTAGDAVTADVMNIARAARESAAVDDPPPSVAGDAETLTVRLDTDSSVKISAKGFVYTAPEGTDPRDTSKWSLISTLPNPGWTIVETCKPVAAEPRKFAAGSREPGQVKRVGRVDRPNVTFTRVGSLPNGNGVWRRDGEAALLEWAHMVKFVPVVEIR
jgi:hypothetical protein